MPHAVALTKPLLLLVLRAPLLLLLMPLILLPVTFIGSKPGGELKIYRRCRAFRNADSSHALVQCVEIMSDDHATLLQRSGLRERGLV